MKAQCKIENALTTVERMTSFSKTFLALNSLVSFMQRKRSAICSSTFLTLRENGSFSKLKQKSLRAVVKLPSVMLKRAAFRALVVKPR